MYKIFRMALSVYILSIWTKLVYNKFTSEQLNSHFIQEPVQAEKPESQNKQLDDDELHRVFPEVVFAALMRDIAANNVAHEPGEEYDGK